MKFLLVESEILGIGIQNPAKEWIQNPFVENPFQIVLTAFTRIHATTVMLKRRPCRPRLFRWRISTVTARETLTSSFMTYRPIEFDNDMAKVSN